MVTESDREKIGNTIVYIASRIEKLSKTKLLKLLYFMEERSVAKYHTPFLGIPFLVWQAGPVAKDVFIDLSETPTILDGFVTKKVIGGATYINAVKTFCDDEFSDNDIEVMNYVIDSYGANTAKELVALTHQPHTLWYKKAQEKDLLQLFESKLMNNTEYVIDFSEILSGKAKLFYQEQLEFIQMTNHYSK